MKSIEDIYQKKWTTYDPEHYKHIKLELIREINNNSENLNAYKMVCQSYEVLNVNIVISTFILSFTTFIFGILPEEIVSKNVENFSSSIGIISILAIVYLLYMAISMNNKEKKRQQILSVLKDIEKEIFTDEVIQGQKFDKNKCH